MKRLLLTLFTFALVLSMEAAPAIAQEARFGFKGGLSMAKLRGDDLDNLDTRTALVIGADVVWPLAPMVDLQPGLFFVNKGAKESDSGYFMGCHYDGEATVKLSYLEVPLLLRISPELNDSVQPFLLLGPAIALKMSAKTQGEATVDCGDHDIEHVDIDEDIEDIKSLDFGLVLGGGVEVPMGGLALALEARYTLGLTTIDDSEYKVDVKNGAFMIMAGIRL